MSKRRFLLPILVFLLASLLALPVASCVGGGPASAVKSFYAAAEDLNAGKIADLWVKEERTDVAIGFAMSFAALDSFSVSNLNINVTSRTGDEARVTTEYDWKAVFKSGETEEKKHETDQFDLVKVDNKWLIKDTDFIWY